MIEVTEFNIKLTNDTLEKLSHRLAFAGEINDRDLELNIVSLVNQYKDNLDEYNQGKDNLNKIKLGVKADQFFPRFSDILKYQLGLEEQRLIILYFLDYVSISANQNTLVQYKTSFLEDLH